MKNVPKLRFKEFSDEWKEYKVGKIFNKIKNSVEVKKNEKYQQIGIRSHGKGIFYKDLVTGEELGNKRVFWVEPDVFIVNIVFAWERAVARTTKKEVGMIASHRFPMYKPKEDILNLDFITYLFKTKKGQCLLEMASPGGAGRNKTLGQKEFDNLSVKLPSLQEQQRIANFLTKVDNLIEKQNEKVNNLEDYKKGMMQKIFSQEIRFKDEKGKKYPEWKSTKLHKIFKERKLYSLKDDEYPHVTLSKDGIYEKGKKYDRDFLVKSNDKKYKITLLNDICYNPANLKFGVICRNKYGNAIFSPIYVTFEVIDGNPIYIENYIKREDFINRVRKYEEGTVYERMAVKPEDFLKFNIFFPCVKEQNRIADFLSKIDNIIEKEKEKLEELRKWKKGLLQQMFV